ncbi:MAG: amidohydrolase family protein [Chthonomonas sp.]|nr:amidohydrolase family protein [Chthonomonas sp.]
MITSLITFLAIPGVLLQGGTIVDGLGGEPYVADLLIVNDRIEAIGNLSAGPNDRVLPVAGLIVAPGFIDAHSHADGGIVDEPIPITQLTQGITTAVVGQDGAWRGPIRSQFGRIKAARPAINFAAFSGHGGIRGSVMGEDYKRLATNEEIERMKALFRADMVQGALGLSSGLEYDPGYYSNTEELVAIAKEAKIWDGMYISHSRDEGDKALEAFREVAEIGKQAGIKAQISHVKLCTAGSWGKAGEVYKIPGVTADVYPYLYWQSTAAALTPSRDWDKREIWVKAFADVGGPQNVRLSSYTHEPTWVGKDFNQISKLTGRDPVELIQEILSKTEGPQGTGSQSVVVTSMTERDLEVFIKNPTTMFCSDGAVRGSHPRGAGSFPRILGRYVRDRKTLTLTEAIRKMTSLPARTFGFKDRGVIRQHAIADLVVFDAATISDHATPEEPQKLSTGVQLVFVSGTITLQRGKATGRRNGQIILRSTP